MKAAIVFYSMNGNTEFVAEEIKKELGQQADSISIKPVKAYPDKGFVKFLWGGKSAVMSEKPKLMPYSFDPEKYDVIIIGSPVWASRIAPPIRSFVLENLPKLREKKLCAYACQAGSGGEKALEGLRKLLDIPELSGTMILADPKEKPAEESKERISAFCRKITEL